MQYTASSFAKPILKIFRSILFFKVEAVRPKGYFPTEDQVKFFCERRVRVFIFPAVLLCYQKIFPKIKMDPKRAYANLYIVYSFSSCHFIDMETTLDMDIILYYYI